MEITPDLIPPRRRWFRFSLRTLLLAMTLLACWLGYQVWRWNERDKAIAQLRALGGEVSFGTNPTPKWLVAMFGEKPFRRVGIVNLHRLPATDEHLQLMAWFPDLETVTINGTQVTDAGLKHLDGMSKLWWLEMEWNNISDEGLAELKDLPSLKALRVTDSRVTNEGVKRALARFKNLQEIWIDRTRVTPEEVAAIRAAWPKLQVVYDRQGKK
jgi:internalin A